MLSNEINAEGFSFGVNFVPINFRGGRPVVAAAAPIAPEPANDVA